MNQTDAERRTSRIDRLAVTMEDRGLSESVAIDALAQATNSGPAVRNPSLVRNVLSNWTVTLAAVVYSLVITPVVIRALDAEMYGIWSFINGLIAYSDLLYLGLGSALIRYVAQFSARDDQAAINRLTSVVLTIFATLGFACLTAMLALSTRVPDLFAHPLPPETSRAATLTCILVGIQLCFFFIGSVFTAILLGHDRFDLVNLGRLLIIGGRFALIGFVLAGPGPLLRLAAFMTVTTAAEIALLATLAWRINPRLRLRFTRPRRDELRLLYGFGFHSFLIVFAVKLISYTDTTVIGLTLGAASVGLYALPLQLIDYVRTALAGFATVFLPRLTVLHAKGDLSSLRAAFVQSSRIAAALAAFLLTNVVFLGTSFLSLWVGPEFGAPVRWVILCLAGATLLHVFLTIGPLSFYQAMHLLEVPERVLLFEAAGNLALSVVLAPLLGITGVAIATVAPAFFVSFMILPRYLCRKLSLSVWSFLHSSLRPALLITAAVAVTHWLAAPHVPVESFISLILRAVVTVPPAVAVAFVSLSSGEQRAVLRYARLSNANAGER